MKIQKIFSEFRVDKDKVVCYSDAPEKKFKVVQCIDLSFFDKSGFQLNVVEVASDVANDKEQ